MSDERRIESAPPDWRDSPFAQQVAAEMGQLQGAILKGPPLRSYLEIGCSFGHSLLFIAEVMQPGAKIRGIDFGYIDEVTAGESKGFSTKSRLEDKIKFMRDRGLDVDIFYGDSHSIEAIKWARANGPYQLVGIDGDHSYEGARADVENYAHLGASVWLHDIANKNLGVMKLWQELKAEYSGRTDEFVCPMGIGVINRTQVIKQS